MAIKVTAAQVLAPTWFTPESQKDESQPARFQVRPLSRFEFLDFIGTPRLGQKARYLLETACLGWDGVLDAEGKPQAFSQEAIGCLPPEILDDVAMHIVAISRPTEEQAKN